MTRSRDKIPEKREHLDWVEQYVAELATELNSGKQEGLQRLLDFFGAGQKCTRWSYLNLIGLLRQRPDIQRPVTIREAAEVGHYPKRGCQAAAIFVPHEIKLPTPERALSEQIVLKPEELPWQVNVEKPGGLRLFHSESLLELWPNDEAQGWSWLKASHPNAEILIEGVADSLAGARDQLMLGLSEEERRSLAKLTQKPAPPKTVTFFNFIPCVVDLSRDTIGPPLLASQCESNGEDAAQILDAIRTYARSVGVEPIAYRRSIEDLTSGSTGTAWGDGRIFVNDAIDPRQQVGTSLHELTHWLIHLRPEADRAESSSPRKQGEMPARPICELQAEACSYVVQRALGLKTRFSIGYLQHLGITKRDLELNLQVINRTSRELLSGILPELKKIRARDSEEILPPAPAISEERPVPASWAEFERAIQNGEERLTKENDGTEEKSLAFPVIRIRGGIGHNTS